MDSDMFKVELKAGVTYVFAFAPSPGDFYYLPTNKTSLQLSSDGLHELASAVGTDHAGPALEYTPTVSGTYYALVDYQNAQLFPDTRTYTYQISAAVKQPDALPANIHTPGVLFAGGSVSSQFEVVGDTDWFRFHATAGHHYAFTASPAATSMKVYGADGQLVDALYAPFEPTATGDYFVAVGGNVAGDYTLQSVLVEDDYSANDSSVGHLTPGGQLQGRLNYTGDRDCFHLAVQAGQTYALVLTGDPADRNEMRFELTDERNYAVANSIPTPETSSTQVLTFTAASSGIYSITVGSLYPGTVVGTGAYTLKASAPLREDHGDSPASATALTLDSAAHGVINSVSDHDVFKLSMVAGESYDVAIGSQFGYSGINHLRVTDQYGIDTGKLDFLSGDLYNDHHAFTPATTGDYYLDVSGESGMDYQLKASLLADDYHANAATTGKLAAGGSATGTLEHAGDHDWLALDMKAGLTYHVTLRSAPGTDLFHGYGTLSLDVVDAQGANLAHNGYISTPAQAELSYVAARSGTYYVDVGAGFMTTGSYVVQVDTSDDSRARDDYSNTPAGASRLAIYTGIEGTLGYPGDIDQFKVTLQAGYSYQFDLQSKAYDGLNPHYHYTVALYDGAGVRLQASSDSLGYRAAADGDYYVAVSADTAAEDATGGYTLKSAPLYSPWAVDPSPNAAPLGLSDVITLDFEGKVKVADFHGIQLTDAAGHAIALDASGPAAASTHLALRPLSHLAPGTTYTLDIAPSAIGNLAGTTMITSLHRSFTTVGAVGAGTDGNDVLLGKANGVAIHGGAGTDMTVFGGNAANYHIARTDGHAEVKLADGSGGTDLLDGVERLQFDDKTIALDIDGVGGKAYRLYQAAFNRAPDESGLGYWISNMDKGLSLQQTAGYFIGSEEFAQRYGANLSDADFVTQLYNNVLHRAPDAGGYAYWMHDLQIGVARANVLANFSESAENQAALVHIIGNGFSYLPYSA
ncbi:DUF4214 domain-containing protein [Rugamonas sp. FT82W]|uniref:DUF4214 domain-containing protein n=1 Tax=Duganella vulcania TaxID=2692166 RepID=A0A845G9N8_9BURK|nr:DUF4214 domain-containing protein [Duganella vulcania]